MSYNNQTGEGKVSNKGPGLWAAYNNQILSLPALPKMPGEKTMPEDREIAGRRVEPQFPGASGELSRKINQLQAQTRNAEDEAAKDAARQAELDEE